MSRPSRAAPRANGRRCMLSAHVVVIRPGNEPSCIFRCLCFSSKTMCGVNSAWGMQHNMVSLKFTQMQLGTMCGTEVCLAYCVVCDETWGYVYTKWRRRTPLPCDTCFPCDSSCTWRSLLPQSPCSTFLSCHVVCVEQSGGKRGTGGARAWCAHPCLSIALCVVLCKAAASSLVSGCCCQVPHVS